MKPVRIPVTLKELLDIYKEEIASRDLLPLPKDFYVKVKSIMLSEQKKEKNNLSRRLKEEEIKVLKNVLEGLFLIRMIKIMEHLANNKDIDRKGLTIEEVELLDHIEALLGKIKGEPIQGTYKRVIKKDLVLFLKHYPSFVASDGNVYGPFLMNDLAYLPHTDSLFLQRKGIVTIIKESSV